MSVFLDTRLIKHKRWGAQRLSKTEKTLLSNGTYRNEEAAAHASDTLARQLIENGEQGHRLNFPDTEVDLEEQQKNKRKRSFDILYEKNKNNLEKFE
jgi:hypothetical protein